MAGSELCAQGDEVDDADDLQGHDYPGYDARVINKLVKIMFKYFTPLVPFCEEGESDKQIEEDIKALSEKIRKHLDMMYNCKSPNQSFGECDYFMSKKAYVFYERLRTGEQTSSLFERLRAGEKFFKRIY